VHLRNHPFFVGPEDKVGLLVSKPSANGTLHHSVVAMSAAQRIELLLDKFLAAQMTLEMHVGDDVGDGNRVYFSAYPVGEEDKAVDPKRKVSAVEIPTWLASVIYTHGSSKTGLVEQIPHQSKVDINTLIKWVTEECLREAQSNLPEETDFAVLHGKPAEVKFFYAPHFCIEFSGTLNNGNALEEIQTRAYYNYSPGPPKWVQYGVGFQGCEQCSESGERKAVMPLGLGTDGYAMIFVRSPESSVRPDSMMVAEKIDKEERSKEKARERRAKLKRKRNETRQMDPTKEQAGPKTE